MKVLIIVILPIIYTYKTRKTIKKKENMVKQDWNKIDNLMKTRNDIIPELIDVTKKYISSGNTLDNINNVRNDLLIAKTKKDKIEHSNKLSSELGYLFAITEDYVKLKENGQFIDLQNKLHDTEDQINKSRKKYNKSAISYKKKIDSFPSNIVAYVFKFKPVTIFEEAKKIETPKIDEVLEIH